MAEINASKYAINRKLKTRAGRGGAGKLFREDRPAPSASPTHDIDVAMVQTAMNRAAPNSGGHGSPHSRLRLKLEGLLRNRDMILGQADRAWIEHLIGPAEVERIKNLHHKDSTPWMLLPGNLPKKPPQAKKT